MIVRNLTQTTILSQKTEVADAFFSRMGGLLGRAAFLPGEALVITQCNSIHMFFMKFPIDAVFIDSKWKVVGLVRNILPNRLSPVFWHADRVIELPAGTIDSTRTSLGDTLQIG